MIQLNILTKLLLGGCLCMLCCLSVTAQTIDSTSTVVLENQPDKLESNLQEEVHLGFQTTTKHDIIGSSSTVKPGDFLKFDTTQWVRDALGGRLTGLRGGSSIRGLGEALIVVDGIPGRSIDLLNMEEIEEITILKDANVSALYGAMARNGVIVVTTKRGSTETQFNISASTGVRLPISMPNYLNSADYMEYFNEARANDGLGELYSAEQIQNHRSGTNPYRYPDVDFHDDGNFNPLTPYSNVTADFSGGSENTRFYINLGFKSDGSFQSVNPENDKGAKRFNVRGNIDFKVNDWIKSSLDVVAIIDKNKTSLSNIYAEGDSIRPNLYSPLLPISEIDFSANPELRGIVDAANQYDGFLLGGNQVYNGGAIASIYAGGYQTNMTRMSQVNNAIDFDLSAITEGLSAKSYVSFDFYNIYNLSVQNEYAVYEPTWNDDNKIIDLVNVRDNDLKDQVENVNTDVFAIRYGFYGLLNYEKQLTEDHAIDASLIGFANNTYVRDEKQSAKNSHVALSLNYDYKKKIYANFSGAYVNSVKLADGNRAKLAPTVGLAYILTQEPSLKDSSWLNYFKLRTSMGVVYTDLGIQDYFLYDAIYQQDGGGYSWGDTNGAGYNNASTKILRGQNPNLDFEKRTDYTLGFEALLFSKMWLEGNVFQSIIGEQVIRASTLYPDYYNSFRPYNNFNKDQYSGFEVGMNYRTKTENSTFDIGARALYTTSKRTIVDEVYEDAYQNRKGTPVDAIWGLESLGLFGVDEFNEDGSLTGNLPTQYGTVKPGDIKYKDQNGDNVVNDQDIVQIGRYAAPWSFGSDITWSYKAFTFFALLTAEIGGDGMLTGNYYRPQGDAKYSDVVEGRWTEATADTATFPRLSSTGNTNNFEKNSTYWMYSNDNFRIQRVQLTFDLPSQLVDKLKMKDINLFTSVSNLAEFSKNKDVRQLQLGFNPMFRYYSFGARMKF
ncbi:SusC/RagA family TonB-linked outer membrane protein [Zobellia alginiliquefaciens]|uniref:SusC/RagA family TonB-linked outer membrane protein n=1 Tax=Zobellia alginiliquefaciens TaxID=3032586 RepID=UPI0023E39382|nr:SusC/RagA family TonB-linked outer membrane protein [Zobellia alginiliquefaciens]